MATLQQIKIRIAREIGRPEAVAEVSEAVASAILHYERKRFWFNETKTAVATVASQENYSLPDNFLSMDQVQFISNNTQWRLEPMPYEWFAERDHTNPIKGQSSYWTVYQDRLFLWPVPDVATYQVVMNYIKKLTAITDGQSNEFSVELERLIRYRAKAYLAMDVLHDANLAQIYKAEETEALRQAESETNRRGTFGRIMAVYL